MDEDIDELYTLTTLGGIKFFYRLRTFEENKVSMLELSYGSYDNEADKSPHIFNEELQTYKSSDSCAKARSDLVLHIRHLGYTPWPSTAKSALKN